MTLKILMISHGNFLSPDSGYLIIVYNLHNCLKNNNYNVNYIQYLMFNKNKSIEDNMILRGPFRGWISLGLRVLIDPFVHYKLIRSNDVIIIESSFFFTFAILARFFKKKVILDSHAFNKMLMRNFKRSLKTFIKYSLMSEIFDRIAIKFSDYIITVSDYDRDFAIKNYKIDSGKIFTVPNSISIPDKNYSETEFKDYFLFVGDLTSLQNYASVVEMIKIAKELPDKTFLVIGRGKELFYGYPANIKFLGYVKDLERYYKNAIACLIPMPYGAGIKTKVLEALVHGKPTITTKIGIEGLFNINEIEYCGLYVKKNTDEIIDLLKSTENFKHDPDCLIKYIKKYFSVEVMCQKLKEFLLKIEKI